MATIAETKAAQAAVQLYDQLPAVATSLAGLKSTVDRATGFKQILLDNGDQATIDAMLAEVSAHADAIWAASEADLKTVLDVVAAMLPNPADPGNMHTRNSLLDSLKVVE